jgi:hypothetical protein
MPEHPDPPRGVHFDTTISLGNVLIVLGMAVAFGSSFLEGRFGVSQAQRDIVALQGVVEKQATDTRKALEASAAQSREAVATAAQVAREVARESSNSVERIILGIQQQTTENLRRLEEWVNTGDGRDEARRSAVDARFDAVQGLAIQNKADIQALRGATGVSLPGSPGIRPR